MGYKTEFNWVLKLKPEQGLEEENLKQGAIHSFEKQEERVYPLHTPIFLANKDWKILGKVRVNSVLREENKTSGEYEILKVYSERERCVLTKEVALLQPHEKAKKEIVVAVSGYFTVLHKGHIHLFEEAKKLGDRLVIIVNNDEQQINKKGLLIHDAEDIKHIISRLHMVDEVVVAVDKDKTVCETLKMIKPDIFANGGDRTAENVPEDKVCKKLNIKLIYNVGGKKVESSSRLIENIRKSN